MKRKTTEEFISEARKIHGDKYDYSEVVYENTHKNVKIKCPYHDFIYITPHSHLTGTGCPKCRYVKSSNTMSTSLIENSIYTIYPVLAQQLHNQNSQTTFPHSNKIGTWNCIHECPHCHVQHQWVNFINQRSSKMVCCPMCYGAEMCPCGYRLTSCEKEKFIKNWNAWKIECFGIDKVVKTIIQRYKRSSKIIWNLTDDICKDMFQMQCFYCGQSDALNGIDRIDSLNGYTKENTVSCCSICNFMKGPLNQIHFLEHIQKILTHDESSTPYKPIIYRKKWNGYIQNAKSRELKFELTKEQFHSLAATSCHYCGTCQENGNGIDRVDNTKGYTMDNVVPCCSLCNIRIKQEWKWEVVLEHLRKIKTLQTSSV
jgi:hypothetical protein